MRTTIDLPDDLLAKAKRFAADAKRRLRAVIEDALRETLGRRRTSRRAVQVKLTIFGTSGPQHGVDLDDSASLLDLMGAPR